MKWDIRQIFTKIVAYKFVILISLAIILVVISLFINDYPVDRTEKDISSIIISDNNLNFSDKCPKCHNEQISSSGINKDRCDGCHKSGHGTGPDRYWDEELTVHEEHVNSITNQKGCLSCHGIPSCNRCHNGHESLSSLSNIEDEVPQVDCKSCHGGFPESKGHTEQRSTFRKSMHSWMGTCRTCHDKDRLRFKDLKIYNISDVNESSLLCYTCHSKQYKDSNHPVGVSENDKGKCVNCHNPHDRQLKSGYLPSINISVGETVGAVKNKVVDNLWIVLIISVFVGSILLELLFKPKKGNVILSKTLRIENDELKTKAIKIKVDNLDPSLLCDISISLRNNNIELIGMSSGKNEVVVFISGQFTKDEEENLIKDIISIEGISAAEYSQEYEVL